MRNCISEFGERGTHDLDSDNAAERICRTPNIRIRTFSEFS
jgi:hypothetical protein